MGFNKVMIVGQAARTPEVRWVNENLAVAEFPLVTERTFRDAGGADRMSRMVVPIVAYGSTAERLKEIPAESGEVLVEGRLKIESWRDQEGKWQSKYCVVAERCAFGGEPLVESAAAGHARAARQPVAAGA